MKRLFITALLTAAFMLTIALAQELSVETGAGSMAGESAFSHKPTFA